MIKGHTVKFFAGAFFLLVCLGVLVFIASHIYQPSTNKLDSLGIQDAQIGETSVQLYIADDAVEQAQGLSHIASLPENTGMLFIFSESHVPKFWMKDMQVAIDIIWIDESGSIVDIDHNIAPETYPESFSPETPVQYVAEFPAGFVVENNVEIGDVLLRTF